jgi:3-oxoacyl-[acyl-carrier-protein] synthase-3
METLNESLTTTRLGFCAEIAGVGAYVPIRVVRNQDLTQFPASAIPLIQQKTGVEERHFAADDESTSDLAAKAVLRCLANAGVEASTIDAIVLSTSSPDRILPPTAARVQALIGASRAAAFDINAVCAGGVFAIQVADAFIRSGIYNTVLVVAAEIYSRFLNPRDFSTMPYFGDGAGAVLLRPSTDPERGVCRTILHTDGSGWDTIAIRAGGAMLPHSAVTNPADVFFAMRGREVYDFAVGKGSEIVSELLHECGISVGEIAVVIAHQANLNVLKAIAERTGIPLERFPITLDRYGNTASASVLIALEHTLASGIVKTGDYVVLVAFGGGLSWAASLIRL